MASTVGDRHVRGVIDLYGAIWSAARATSIRQHLDIVVEITMVIAWFVIRTTTSVDDGAYVLWVTARSVCWVTASICFFKTGIK